MCYCKVSRSTGVLILATVQLLSAICTLVWIFLGIPATYFGQLLLLIVIISTIVNLLIPGVLVTSILNKEREKRILFLRVWLSWEVAFILYLLLCVVYVALYQWDYSDGESFHIFAINGISFFLHCYFLYTVFDFYERTLLERETSTKPTNTAIPTRTVIHTEI